MTIQEATYYLLNKLRAIYDDGESSQITDWTMEYITGSKKAERMVYKNATITSKEQEQLEQIGNRLSLHEPVQYVLQEAWFCGMKLYVDKSVLIPRPETEELVDWVVKEFRNQVIGRTISVLDVGTGSGCIPIALKRNLAAADIWGCDISEAALEVARKNAGSYAANINFVQLNFLEREKWEHLSSFDIIISNPPYVPEKEKEQMDPNVVNYEPHTALFVPDNDALIFYKAIAEFADKHLNPAGVIFVELHELLGDAASRLFQQAGYKIELRKDIQGKPRMLKAII